ncbi:hypothetical protein ABIA16_003587 [Sinorhizobium fredii]
MSIQKEFVWFPIRRGEPVEQRFMSDPALWPRNGELYALASDPEAVARVYAHAEVLARKCDPTRFTTRAVLQVLKDMPMSRREPEPVRRRPPAGLFKRPTI